VPAHRALSRVYFDKLRSRFIRGSVVQSIRDAVMRVLFDILAVNLAAANVLPEISDDYPKSVLCDGRDATPGGPQGGARVPTSEAGANALGDPPRFILLADDDAEARMVAADLTGVDEPNEWAGVPSYRTS
jgi:hypothetical protein